MVWVNNLFGRATHNLVLAEQVKEAYEAVDQRAEGRRRHPAVAAARPAAEDPDVGRWPPTTRRRSGPAATTTTSSRCPTASGAS